MKTLEELLNNNKNWANSHFEDLSHGQDPEFLWIGCSDSRIPAETITRAKPGQLFVHRNVANLVHEDDPSAGSVITYAVRALKVKHIVVCGHHGCGGVKAAYDNIQDEPLKTWLSPIQETINQYGSEIESQETEVEKLNCLSEYNVAEQVKIIKKMPVIKEAHDEGRNVYVHGVVYNIKSGVLKLL